jgi:N-acetylglucosamine-6-phosphate deacetylase
VTPFEALKDHALIIEHGTILGMIPQNQYLPQAGDTVIDCTGKWVTPGLIDIHVHGANLADTMDGSHEAYETLGRFFARHGVTAYLLTTGAAPNERISTVLRSYAGYTPSPNSARPLGIHLEGPYLGEKNKGAQPVEHLRNPNPQEYIAWFASGIVRLMTIAPELKGSAELIRYGLSCGVEFAVGHSEASYDQMQAAIGYGLRQATHTFNGMNPLHHREPGVVGAVLADHRVYAQVIPDGIHVHPAVVKTLVRAKGVERTILITDSIRAAGLPDGDYELLGHTVHVQDQIARVDSGSLAGSVVTMDAAVRNAMRFCDISLSEAVRMASYTPAESLHLTPLYGQLAPGSRADLAIFDPDLTIHMTLVGGNIAYQKS